MKHQFVDQDGNLLYESEIVITLKDEIKQSIKNHLVFDRLGYVDHFINGDRVQRYEINHKNGLPSLVIMKGSKKCYISLK